MSVANKFLEELLSGKIDEAITTIQSSLRESTTQSIEEQRTEILESYGFVKLEEKEDEDEEDDKDEKEDSSDEEDEKDDE